MNNIDFSRQRYVDLLSNAGFSAVFADEKNSDVVIDFLNIILEGERVVKSIRYVRNEFGGLTVSAKGYVLTSYAKMRTAPNSSLKCRSADTARTFSHAACFTAQPCIRTNCLPETSMAC